MILFFALIFAKTKSFALLVPKITPCFFGSTTWKEITNKNSPALQNTLDTPKTSPASILPLKELHSFAPLVKIILLKFGQSKRTTKFRT